MTSRDPVMAGAAPYERFANDAYFTLDASMVVSTLLAAYHPGELILEPAAGRGHLCVELAGHGCTVMASDLHRYDPVLLAPKIETGVDLMSIKTLRGYDSIVTNLPYDQQDEMLGHLLPLAMDGDCDVIILTRAAWHLAKSRKALVHDNPHFHGIATLPRRPWWSKDKRNSPRHDFVWMIWDHVPRAEGVEPVIYYPVSK